MLLIINKQSNAELFDIIEQCRNELKKRGIHTEFKELSDGTNK